MRFATFITFLFTINHLSAASGWIPRAGQNPDGRYAQAMATDTVRNQVVMFGGNTQAGTSDETWLWNGIWTMPTKSGPGEHARAAMAFNSTTGETILFGGLDSNNNLLSDTW